MIIMIHIMVNNKKLKIQKIQKYQIDLNKIKKKYKILINNKIKVKVEV